MRNQCRCKIILRNELLSAKNGMAPLALRCLINGSRVVIAINLYVRPEYWDQVNQRVI